MAKTKGTWAYDAVAYIGGKPAGFVGRYLAKSDYRPYRSAPPVRWTRVRVSADEAARIAALKR